MTMRPIDFPVELDGSDGEGGGQILRTGLALSMITQRPLSITKIRARRPKPGLMRQHLACVQAARDVCGATVEGDVLGSTSLQFTPGPVKAGRYGFAIASAGSCMLLLQTLLPALLLADDASEIELSGGTHNPMAPPFHFIEQTLAPLVTRLGGRLDLELRRCGFYPAGGGSVLARITPGPLVPFDLMERGAALDRAALCLAPALARNVAQRELETLASLLGWPQEQLQLLPARQNEGPGNALMARLAYEHVTELITVIGEKSVPAESVAHSLVDEVRRYLVHTAPVGEHLADQLALLMALACWKSGRPAAFACTGITPHTRTNCAVIERFLMPLRIEIDPAQVLRITP
ncbi:RNA 3'-terminal phosphate cyclase [Pelomonas sp. KK5]|uniref:RNA 3'-terminal phosphate cyclase n=1 Tax=Pelomonas sp. KK5 TaxID=1855730 RepID=UPI0009F9A90D|nr:RNA 3'-terminal phosphate cyclase [Pelomonas sp. KK5]